MREGPPGFRDYVVTRLDPMRRTAYLLCGDWHLADDIVSTALGRLAGVGAALAVAAVTVAGTTFAGHPTTTPGPSGSASASAGPDAQAWPAVGRLDAVWQAALARALPAGYTVDFTGSMLSQGDAGQGAPTGTSPRPPRRTARSPRSSWTWAAPENSPGTPAGGGRVARPRSTVRRAGRSACSPPSKTG
jgi:hypothetical protein